MVVKGFWILTHNGISLFSYDKGTGIQANSQLFSGFLSAVFKFSQHIGLTPTKQTETERLKFLYNLRSHLVFVLAGDKQTKTEILEMHFNKLQNMFFKAFESMAWEKFLKENVDVACFSVFEEKVNDLIRKQKPLEMNLESLNKAFFKLAKQSSK